VNATRNTNILRTPATIRKISFHFYSQQRATPGQSIARIWAHPVISQRSILGFFPAVQMTFLPFDCSRPKSGPFAF
jgi:hypothetical protein